LGCVPESTPYEIQILRARNEKNVAFKNYPESPIPDSLRKDFKELSYFPIHEDWIFNAKWDSTQNIEVSENKNKAGTLTFFYQQKKYNLQAYWGDTITHKFLFVPFKDLTSGKSTYGGGRYIDVICEKDSLKIDFNMAYHPFCVYNHEYVCEIPPACNKLAFEVMAGEKLK